MSEPNLLDNLIRLLETDRVAEAKKEQADNPEAIKAFDWIDSALDEDESFNCDCQDCNTWDGVSRLCLCGNCRVYWNWDGESWRAEVY